MNTYEAKVRAEVAAWAKKMSRRASLTNRLTRNVQTRLNNLLPEKVHKIITGTMKQMVKGVLWGSAVTSRVKDTNRPLAMVEFEVLERIKWYRRTASAEGGIAGAGGFMLALAEFPVLLTTKIKLLFDIAPEYGMDINDYRERLFILHIFQLTYSGQDKRREIFLLMRNWNEYAKTLPAHLDDFNWQSFQQEYRDYLDLAKLVQLIPGIGIAVGVVVNYRLIDQLGNAAMNAYRMRLGY
jgi:hypothetical protein